MAIVPHEALLEPRTEADIVLPMEFSPQLDLTWVRQGYDTMANMARTIDTCIIVGLSYQPCDRKEIDSILQEVPSSTQILLVNPTPNPTFETRLREVSRKSRRTKPTDFLRT